MGDARIIFHFPFRKNRRGQVFGQMGSFHFQGHGCCDTVDVKRVKMHVECVLGTLNSFLFSIRLTFHKIFIIVDISILNKSSNQIVKRFKDIFSAHN